MIEVNPIIQSLIIYVTEPNKNEMVMKGIHDLC